MTAKAVTIFQIAALLCAATTLISPRAVHAQAEAGPEPEPVELFMVSVNAVEALKKGENPAEICKRLLNPVIARLNKVESPDDPPSIYLFTIGDAVEKMVEAGDAKQAIEILGWVRGLPERDRLRITGEVLPAIIGVAMDEGGDPLPYLEEFADPLIGPLIEASRRFEKEPEDASDYIELTVSLGETARAAMATGNKEALASSVKWFDSKGDDEKLVLAELLVPTLLKSRVAIRLNQILEEKSDPGEFELPELSASNLKLTEEALAAAPDGLDPALLLKHSGVIQASLTPGGIAINHEDMFSFIHDRPGFFLEVFKACFSGDEQAADNVLRFEFFSEDRRGVDEFYGTMNLAVIDIALTRKLPAAALGSMLSYSGPEMFDSFWDFGKLCDADPESILLGQLTYNPSAFSFDYLQERASGKTVRYLTDLLQCLAKDPVSSERPRIAWIRLLHSLLKVDPDKLGLEDKEVDAAFDALVAVAGSTTDHFTAIDCLKALAESGRKEDRELIDRFMRSPHPRIVEGAESLMGIPLPPRPAETIEFQVILDGEVAKDTHVKVLQHVAVKGIGNPAFGIYKPNTEGQIYAPRGDATYLNEKDSWISLASALKENPKPDGALWVHSVPLAELVESKKIEINTRPAAIEITLPEHFQPLDGDQHRLQIVGQVEAPEDSRPPFSNQNLSESVYINLDYKPGTYDLPRLAPGSYEFFVDYPGALLWEGEVEVEEGDEKVVVKVPLKQKYSIRLLPKLSDGTDLNSAGVIVREKGEKEDEDPLRGRVHKDQDWTLGGLGIGKYELEVPASREFRKDETFPERTLKTPEHKGAERILSFEIKEGDPLVKDLGEVELGSE